MTALLCSVVWKDISSKDKPIKIKFVCRNTNKKEEMAKLRIYNEICDEETKVMFQDWCGTDGVCYKDIQEFLDSIDDGDDEIDIRLHCPGGDCIEGWAIYDALRNSGKTITATIEGECSSMATIILLAAPKERRFGYENSRLCIHNPAVEWIDLCSAERLTADELGKMQTKLTAQQQSLLEEQNKILNLYVERTGADRGELQALMNEDKYVDMDRAVELGFVSSTIAPNTATKKNHNKNKTTKMEKISIESKVVKKLLALAGIAKIEDVQSTILNQKITAADGTEFTVEREDGDPQVGDKAYPNGTYTLDDGTVIVIEDEVIASITPAGGDEGGEDGEQDLKALQQQVADLTAQVETLTGDNESLKAEKEALEKQITDLKAEKEALTTAQKTEEDKEILATVAKAGGKSWLDAVCAMKSTFHAGNRSFVERPQGNVTTGETKTQKLLREQRERQQAKREAKK